MYAQLTKVIYVSILKWKQGEYSALGTLPKRLADLVLPLFVMPPSGGFDHETGRILEPLEHIKTLSRLYTNWANRLAFIDAVHLDDTKHRSVLPRHPLTEVLERARLGRGRACPVTALDRSEDYQNAVANFVKQHDGVFPVCIRLRAGDLDRPALKADIESLLTHISCKPEKVVLVLDFEDFSIADETQLEEFSSVLIERINTLPFLNDWLMLVLASTSFPETLKLKAGEMGAYPRSEWAVYSRLNDERANLLRFPVYGDYANENPVYNKPINAPPSAQLRYTTGLNHLVFKGKSTRKPNGYEAIFPVADSLVANEEYMGETFSLGDGYMAALTRHLETGNAPKWRWAATDHHINLVLRLLGSMIGVLVEVAEEDDGSNRKQLVLFESQ